MMSQAQATITLDMQKFYAHWDPQQKETVNRDKVDKYKLYIDAGKSLDPIVIDGVADTYIKIVALDTPGAREAKKFLENLA